MEKQATLIQDSYIHSINSTVWIRLVFLSLDSRSSLRYILETQGAAVLQGTCGDDLSHFSGNTVHTERWRGLGNQWLSPMLLVFISHCCIMNVSTSLVVSNVEAASLGSCWWLRAIFAWQVALDTSVQRSDNIKHSYRKVFEYCYVSYVKHVKLVVISSCLTGRSVGFHCSGLGGAALIADWEIKMVPKTNAETPPPCRGTDGAGQNTGAGGVMERPVGAGTVGA